ncbi:hypothetical protein O7632_01100 [Solwaraspora sp. WMMD406]|uniref:hypothetical protein n=1 Tax=Solwaraspora sp. WMMD406 TaxID=3016095 RepID=UPI0024169E06|nr:hypothetical protein [Solwaraspora sp. WMMD406]MDG4762719.1 hypothetical protein [Solwaraspora sp. WMMD406]
MDFTHRRRVELRPTIGQQTGSRQSVTPGVRAKRRPRHAGLFEAVRRLDAGLDTAARAELAAWVRQEYEQEYGDVPLGFVSECFLGPPYVDHRLDLFQSILDHFAPADPMPEPFAQARTLVRTGGYAFIEVYASGTLRPVLPDGTVVD